VTVVIVPGRLVRWSAPSTYASIIVDGARMHTLPPAQLVQQRWAGVCQDADCGHHEAVTDRAHVRRWLAGYEAAWRAPGTKGLDGLFTGNATYLQSPYEQPITGLDAIKRMWEEERDGPGEVFTVVTSILAVDGPTAVVRAEVCYGAPPREEYRDLWVIRLADDGRCSWFEEWPYWPGRPYSARGNLT
jgi:hypothetical protein